MPKTSLNDQISAAFEEIAEALNNPKLREGFLNGNKQNVILNEIVEIFDRRTTVHRPRVSSGPNTKTNAHIPARVKPMCEQKLICEQKAMSEQTLAENKRIAEKQTKLSEKEAKEKPLTIHPRGTFITNYLIKILESHDTWILSTNRILQSKILQQ